MRSDERSDETVVDVEAAFPTHGDPAELVQQGEGLFDDVAQLAQTFDVRGLGLGDDRFGAVPAGFGARWARGNRPGSGKRLVSSGASKCCSRREVPARGPAAQ
ncbi:hypothetical protein DMB66_30285 [Actinoplanes sp. ATCC 53533]|uniref:hypothetical protein n=1 Tax=Actinoplanes sp. ATCC 53533 TaxID=1288362 RepID=UPI000F7991AC|nr:hypothetical protein DMB66_30285 [Actinoplanes sp. ATCC 53533]